MTVGKFFVVRQTAYNYADGEFTIPRGGSDSYLILDLIPTEVQMNDGRHVFGIFLKVFSIRIVLWTLQQMFLGGSLKLYEILQLSDFLWDFI